MHTVQFGLGKETSVRQNSTLVDGLFEYLVMSFVSTMFINNIFCDLL